MLLRILGGYDTASSVWGVAAAHEASAEECNRSTYGGTAHLLALHRSPHQSVASWKSRPLKPAYRLPHSKMGYSMSSLPVRTPQIQPQRFAEAGRCSNSHKTCRSRTGGSTAVPTRRCSHTSPSITVGPGWHV